MTRSKGPEETILLLSLYFFGKSGEVGGGGHPPRSVVPVFSI